MKVLQFWKSMDSIEKMDFDRKNKFFLISMQAYFWDFLWKCWG